MKALGLSSVETYGEYIFDEGALEEELPHLIDCMTTNKTDFFREPSHFTILTDHIVPDLLMRQALNQQRTLKIWSAASSIGAEAFTIAMVLDQALKGRPRVNYSVLGTDICRDVLEQAARAIYPIELIAPVPSDMQKRYFMKARDPRRAEVRVVPELRRNVRVQHLNLMDATYPVDRDIDVIFCRNILIYFSKEIQEASGASFMSEKPGCIEGSLVDSLPSGKFWNAK